MFYPDTVSFLISIPPVARFGWDLFHFVPGEFSHFPSSISLLLAPSFALLLRPVYFCSCFSFWFSVSFFIAELLPKSLTIP